MKGTAVSILFFSLLLLSGCDMVDQFLEAKRYQKSIEDSGIWSSTDGTNYGLSWKLELRRLPSLREGSYVSGYRFEIELPENAYGGKLEIGSFSVDLFDSKGVHLGEISPGSNTNDTFRDHVEPGTRNGRGLTVIAGTLGGFPWERIPMIAEHKAWWRPPRPQS